MPAALRVADGRQGVGLLGGEGDNLQGATRLTLQLCQLRQVEFPEQRRIVGALVVGGEVGPLQVAAEQLGARHAALHGIGDPIQGACYGG